MNKISQFPSKVRTFFILLQLLSLASPAFSKDSTPLLPGKDSYQYPELLVVPRASQELAMEAANEKRTSYGTHFLLEAPALLTLMAGLSASGLKDPDGKNASLIATSVGAGWLAAAVGLSVAYSPYRSGLSSINNLPAKTPEQTLARERSAEESLYFPAYVMRRLQYISAITNFGASAAIASQDKASGQCKALASVAAAAAFLPLIFDHPWISNYDQHQDYKKKIYGPLTQISLEPNIQTGQLQPAINLSLRF